ncbi:hypothetical protein PTTG_30216 [Puccinia triticina 1-1 BBBD Race 1]|uniref:Uncharacterized protein n=1 Tax=Puccinia triticina (isolate 1-1 / race 1 (BBBD)) TaxID=630390 RepID=A0A180FZM1_PUCT1|nr:hypothetical protein PTTG_30216 [Puccinia triticina 1-1 BBBD Race 1]
MAKEGTFSAQDYEEFRQSWDPIVSCVLSNEPIQTVDGISEMIKSFEQRLERKFSLQPSLVIPPTTKPPLICYYCHQEEHSMARCRELQKEKNDHLVEQRGREFRLPNGTIIPFDSNRPIRQAVTSFQPSLPSVQFQSTTLLTSPYEEDRDGEQEILDCSINDQSQADEDPEAFEHLLISFNQVASPPLAEKFQSDPSLQGRHENRQSSDHLPLTCPPGLSPAMEPARTAIPDSEEEDITADPELFKQPTEEASHHEATQSESKLSPEPSDQSPVKPEPSLLNSIPLPANLDSKLEILSDSHFVYPLDSNSSMIAPSASEGIKIADGGEILISPDPSEPLMEVLYHHTIFYDHLSNHQKLWSVTRDKSKISIPLDPLPHYNLFNPHVGFDADFNSRAFFGLEISGGKADPNFAQKRTGVVFNQLPISEDRLRNEGKLPVLQLEHGRGGFILVEAEGLEVSSLLSMRLRVDIHLVVKTLRPATIVSHTRSPFYSFSSVLLRPIIFDRHRRIVRAFRRQVDSRLEASKDPSGFDLKFSDLTELQSEIFNSQIPLVFALQGAQDHLNHPLSSSQNGNLNSHIGSDARANPSVSFCLVISGGMADLSFAWSQTGVGSNQILTSEDRLRNEGKLLPLRLERGQGVCGKISGRIGPIIKFGIGSAGIKPLAAPCSAIGFIRSLWNFLLLRRRARLKVGRDNTDRHPSLERDQILFDSPQKARQLFNVIKLLAWILADLSVSSTFLSGHHKLPLNPRRILVFTLGMLPLSYHDLLMKAIINLNSIQVNMKISHPTGLLKKGVGLATSTQAYSAP